MTGVGNTIFILTTIKPLLTGKAQTEVGTLTVSQRVVLVHLDTLLQSIVVGAVVRDVELSVAVNQREVATAIQSTDMLRSYGNQVTSVDIAQRCRHITEDGHRVGINLITTHCHITTCKHCVADNDAVIVKSLPLRLVVNIFLSLQFVQSIGRHIVILGVGRASNGNAFSGQHLGVGFYHHLAVLRPSGTVRTICRIVITSGRVCAQCRLLTYTIDIPHVATAKYITIAFLVVLRCTNLTTTDKHFRLTEHVAIGVERAHLTEVVVALATAIDIAHDMTIIHLDVGLSIFVDTFERTLTVLIAGGRHRTTSDGSNLATAKDTVTHKTAIHLYIGKVHATVVDIAATESVATTQQTIMAYVVSPCLVVQFFFVVLVPCCRWVILP